MPASTGRWIVNRARLHLLCTAVNVSRRGWRSTSTAVARDLCRTSLAILLLVLAAAAGWPPPSLEAQDGADRARPAGVVVRGEVVDHGSGGPLRNAVVSLVAGPGGTSDVGTKVTDGDGRFLFHGVPPGSYRLTVRMRDYRSLVDTLSVPDDADLDLMLPLATGAAPVDLEPVVIEAERPERVEAEGEDPRRAAFVVTREEIEERRPRMLTEVLLLVPGVHLEPAAVFGSRLLLRGGCEPGIWIDKSRMLDVASLDQMLSPDEVEEVEVYHGFELPVELGVNPCGGVVVRTRVGGPSQAGPRVAEGPGIWRRLAMASGALLLILLTSR